MRSADKAQAIFDALASHREGLTKAQIADITGIAERALGRGIRALRMTFADDRENVVCEPRGWKKQWVYKLSGDHEDFRFWPNNRVRDAETRIETIRGVMTSVTHMTDGRSVVGRKARRVRLVLTRLMEDLSEITEDATA